MNNMKIDTVNAMADHVDGVEAGENPHISNLVNLAGQCDCDLRGVSHLSQCDEEYGRRMAEGLGMQVSERPTAETAGAR